MSYRFSEDQRRIQGLIRRVAAERVAPRAMEIDAKAEYPQDVFDLLGSSAFSLYRSRPNMAAAAAWSRRVWRSSSSRTAAPLAGRSAISKACAG